MEKKLHLDENDQDIEELLKYLKDWVIKKKESNYFVFDMSNDEVFNKLLELFEGKTGKVFNIEERQNIEQEGEKRYEAKMPPGYMERMVLCQDLVQVKMRFPHLNLPAAIRHVEAYDTALRNRLVTHSHSDYEFVSYCRMLLNIRKPIDMHARNL